MHIIHISLSCYKPSSNKILTHNLISSEINHVYYSRLIRNEYRLKINYLHKICFNA